MTRIAIAAVTLMLLGGCANTGPMKIGKDSYSISTRVALSGSSGAKGEALKSANAYCTSQGKFVQLQTQDAHECALRGGCGEAAITFWCLDETDPRYTATQLRKDNGVNTIEVR